MGKDILSAYGIPFDACSMRKPGLGSGTFSISPISVSDHVVVAGPLAGSGNCAASVVLSGLTVATLIERQSYISIGNVDNPIAGEWHELEPAAPAAPLYDWRQITSTGPDPFDAEFLGTWFGIPGGGVGLTRTALRFGAVGEIRHAIGDFQIRDAVTLQIMGQFNVNVKADTTYP